jgi:hypothetical protein
VLSSSVARRVKDPSAEYQPATTESLSVDVTHKPLISVVWGGFYVLMAGALLAFIKRSRDARRLLAAEEAGARNPGMSWPRRTSRFPCTGARASTGSLSPV